MSLTWWTVLYGVTASFLLWVAYGRGLQTLLGGVLADLMLEGPEHQSDRAIRRIAKFVLVLETIWFLLGLMDPSFRLVHFF